MLLATRAIVLRTVPYGDTSLVVSAFTYEWGLQSYLVKGARSSGKKGGSLRAYLQPSAVLDLVVYHKENEQLQFIKEMGWSLVPQFIFSSVTHHAVASFIIELLSKCIRQQEHNTDIFELTEQYLTLLDTAEPAVLANLPIHFSLQLAGLLGFMPENNFDAEHSIFDVQEGKYCTDIPWHGVCLSGKEAVLLHQLLVIEPPVTLYRIKMNRQQRQALIHCLQAYYFYHVAEFGTMKSTEVLEMVFNS